MHKTFALAGALNALSSVAAGAFSCASLLALGCASLLALGCASGRPRLPPPPVHLASPALRSLRVHVVNASMREVERAHENVNWYTVFARDALQRAMVRAGYTVVIQAVEPHDLEARLNLQLNELSPGSLGVATLLLATPAGTVVEQLSSVARLLGSELDETAFASLVDAMSDSARTAELARRGRSACERLSTLPSALVTVPSAPSP